MTLRPLGGDSNGGRKDEEGSRLRTKIYGAVVPSLLFVACSGTPGTTVAPTIAPSPVATASPTPTSDSPIIEPGDPWIVYMGGRGEPPLIRLVRPDGTGDHALAPAIAAGAQLHPDWSRDGARIAFSADDADGTRDIWVAGTDGSGVTKLVDCSDPCGWADDPSWSLDGASILYQQGTTIGVSGLGVGTLQSIDLTTRVVSTIATAAETEYYFVPRWSPEGRSIVVEVDRHDSGRLDASLVVASTVGVIDLGATASFEPLLPWESRSGYPDWSPTGDTIVFHMPASGTEPEGPADIYTMGVANGTPIRLTDLGASGGRAIQPSWAPDGLRIVLLAEASIGTPSMAVVRSDGTGLEIYPNDGRVGTHPRLRPTR